MQGKDALHGDALCDFAHRYRFLNPSALALDYYAFKKLQAFFIALDNPHVDAHGITRTDIG